MINFSNKKSFIRGTCYLLLVIPVMWTNVSTFAALPEEDRGTFRPLVSPTNPEQKIKESRQKSLEKMFEALGVGRTISPTINLSSPSIMPPIVTPPPSGSNQPFFEPGDLNLEDTGMTYSADQVNAVMKCLGNIETYKLAERQTGVPWKVLAGIHFVEGSCNPEQSCVSGRKIGVNEPDLGGNCAQNADLGRPKPLPGGGCGFTNLLDTCVYGANHLKNKIVRSDGVNFSRLDQLAMALGRYNGTGNANCGRIQLNQWEQLPYCPVPYEGYDHIYPFNKYDEIHKTMYLVYCADRTKCNPPRVWTRLGVLAVTQILTKLGY